LKKLYVGNLSYNTSEQDLETAFAAFGTVTSVKVIRDRETGNSRGFAFVEMESDEGAAAAIEGLSSTQLDGRTIVVSEARERSDRSDRFRGRGGGRGEGRRRY
jgi:cold-inducible RNA-binding protein